MNRILAYDSGPHALRQLMLLRKDAGRITKCPEKLVDLSGDPYYFAEVTSNRGTRYIIEAHGKEAIELRREVMEREAGEKVVITTQDL